MNKNVLKIIFGHKYFDTESQWQSTCFPTRITTFWIRFNNYVFGTFVEPVVLDNLAVIKGSFIRHRLTLWWLFALSLCRLWLSVVDVSHQTTQREQWHALMWELRHLRRESSDFHSSRLPQGEHFNSVTSDCGSDRPNRLDIILSWCSIATGQTAGVYIYVNWILLTKCNQSYITNA